MLLRRRVSPLGQQALRQAWQFAEAKSARYVFASRHGEFVRTLSIMDSLVRSEGVSPADFTLSVHHALAGLLSIASGNPRGHTTVAAGPESFCNGMLEAVACLAESPSEPVLLVYFDAPLPEPFDVFDGGTAIPLAIVLAMTADGPDPMALSVAPTSAATAGPAAGTTAPGETAALAFLHFLLSGSARARCIGERLSWLWERPGATA